MVTTIRATFDGKVLHPSEPLDLEPDTEVEITIRSADEERPSFHRVARSLKLKGPPDYSTRWKDYLYGDAEFDDADPD